MSARTICKDMPKIWANWPNLVSFVIAKDGIRWKFPTDGASTNCKNPWSYIYNCTRSRSFISCCGNHENPILDGMKCSYCSSIFEVFVWNKSKWNREDIYTIMYSSLIASQYISIQTVWPANLVWSNSRVGRTTFRCSISWAKQVCPRNKTTSCSGESVGSVTIVISRGVVWRIKWVANFSFVAFAKVSCSDQFPGNNNIIGCYKSNYL